MCSIESRRTVQLIYTKVHVHLQCIEKDYTNDIGPVTMGNNKRIETFIRRYYALERTLPFEKEPARFETYRKAINIYFAFILQVL